MERSEIKILAVDDSATILRVLSNALIQNCKISPENFYTANDGEEGLEIFKIAEPHLVLSDWHMPKMNGIDFITEVRKLDSKVTIMMLTTEGERTRVVQALKAGANDYIVKPFTPEVITKKINGALDIVLRRYS